MSPALAKPSDAPSTGASWLSTRAASSLLVTVSSVKVPSMTCTLPSSRRVTFTSGRDAKSASAIGSGPAIRSVGTAEVVCWAAGDWPVSRYSVSRTASHRDWATQLGGAPGVGAPVADERSPVQLSTSATTRAKVTGAAVEAAAGGETANTVGSAGRRGATTAVTAGVIPMVASTAS